MKKRPQTVTAVGWLIILLSLVFFALAIIGNIGGVFFTGSGTIPDYFYYTTYAVAIIDFILGFYILKGQSFARTCYVVIHAIGLLILVSTAHKAPQLKDTMVGVGLAIVVYIIFISLLYGGEASAFFNSKKKK